MQPASCYGSTSGQRAKSIQSAPISHLQGKKHHAESAESWPKAWPQVLYETAPYLDNLKYVRGTLWLGICIMGVYILLT